MIVQKYGSNHSVSTASSTQFSTTSEKNMILVLLDLENYKTTRCGSKKPFSECRCTCVYYHSDKDVRRPWKRFRYAASRCEGNCLKQNCKFSNNIIEQKYHPTLYKKKFCRKLLCLDGCEFGDVCPYAHGERELKIRPLHLLPIDRNFMFFEFKSQFCPFSWQRHNGFSCVYAHNWQDFKRPYFYGQLPELCPDWKENEHIENYEDNCPRGFGCVYCHGWKELNFHPAKYKSERCVKPEHQLPTQQPGFRYSSLKLILHTEAVLTRHICCGFHSDELPGPSSSKFFPAPRQLSYQARTTQDFISEILETPPKETNPRPHLAKEQVLLFDYLFFESAISRKEIATKSTTCIFTDQNSYTHLNHAS